MGVSSSSITSVVTLPAWIVVQTAAPSPTTSPTPTPADAGGLGAAVLLLGLFLAVAALVTVGGAAIAG